MTKIQNHADKSQETPVEAAASRSLRGEKGGEGVYQFVDNRPEAGKLARLQEMADNSPQAQKAAHFQAMSANSPQSQKAARFQEMADNSPGSVAQRVRMDPSVRNPALGEKAPETELRSTPGPEVLQRQPDDPPSGGTGTTLGGLFRGGINSIANFFGGLNAREHYYSTPQISLGPITDTFNAASTFTTLSQGPVGLTVPGAITGAGGELFGPREEGGTAYAFLGGPVTTNTDAGSSTISNVVQNGHLFGGRIDQRIWEENGQVMTQIVGSGSGNFAKINELVGVPLFTDMARFQKAYLSGITETPESL